MPLLLSCQNLTKSFGARPLFQDISLGISDGDQVGMIGPNGSGKSTFLKILAGLEHADHGEISVSRQAKICYLPQDDHFDEDKTIHEILLSTLKNENLEDYEKETEVAILISKVGFTNPDVKAQSLSGGWRKRLAIACQLIQKPDLFLLDEPTNHLDLEGIWWLEKILKSSPFAYVAISHDRTFLENISARVIELNRRYPEGHLSASGSYSDFLIKREEFFHEQVKLQETLANKVRREVEWLRRGPKARTTKAHSRIKEAHQLIQDLGEVKSRNSETRTLDIRFTGSDRKTKKLISVSNLKKARGGRTLFEDLSFTLSPGIKLGLLGLNGSGKTTLLKILSGQLERDGGKMEVADHLRIVYFDQKREQLDTSLTLKQALAPEGDQVVYRDHPIHVATWAKRFLFDSEQLGMPVSALSGGERARILIAQLMRQPADVLILDEPTNDLDIPTLEVLEDSLSDFPGALVLVTHDRYMLDRISTHLLALDGQGHTEFYADYSQWEMSEQNKKAEKTVEKKTIPDAAKTISSPKPKKLSYKEQLEWDQMEEAILKAEDEVAKHETQMQDPSLVSNAEKLQEVCLHLKEAQDLLEKLYSRWAELEQKQKNLS